MKTITAVAAVAVMLAAGSAHAQSVTLKFAGWAPPNLNVNVVSQEWAKNVERESNGEVKIEFFWETLANARTAYDAVKNGVADVSWILQPLVTGKFPRSGVVDLPFLVETSAEGSALMWRLYQKGLIAEEYDEVKPMAIASLPPSMLHSRDPITTVAQMEGKKYRIAGRISAQMATAVGGSGVQLAITQVYEALSRGVIDASFSPWIGFLGFKHEEVTKHHLEVPLGAIGAMNAMNRRTWDRLSPKAKAAIEKVSYETLSRAYGRVNDEDVKNNREKVASLPGHTVTKLAPAERKLLEEKFAPITAEWIRSTPNGAAIFAAAQAELKAIRAGQ
jgi:TRAP-type C4-dicarboxylate transport system substrate-binding protein